MNSDLKVLSQKLEDVLKPRQRVMTAYSGGVDSTLVAVVARRVLGYVNAPAVIGNSASLPRRELEEARQLAEKMDFQLIEVNPGEQEDLNYQANASNRCYFCKSHLYESLHRLAGELGFQYIANGTNTDDLGDHRPGLQAAQQAEIISPLLEAGLCKADVRALAHELKLPNADKPAAACLASRIPYGTAVTPERLNMVEQGENALYELGFNGFRVRHHESIARIELPVDQWARLIEPHTREKVLRAFSAIGYIYITLDMAGFRSGSGNLVLQHETEK